MTEVPEIFPVHLAINGQAIWLGWMSSDSGDCFVANANRIVWSSTCPGLWSAIDAVWTVYQRGEPSFFNVDLALEHLRHDRIGDIELLMNIWNLLTDFHNTGGRRARLFHERHFDTYQTLFANCEVADWVGVEHQDVELTQVRSARVVIEDGVAMILSATVNG